MIDGYYREVYEEAKFDYLEFYTDKTDPTKKTRVEGRRIKIVYYGKEQGIQGSGLVVLRTFQEEAKSVNGQILYEDEPTNERRCDASRLPMLTFRYEKNDIPVWVEVRCPDFVRYQVTIVEERPFRLQTKLSQAGLRTAIDAQGKAVLHVNFDFSKATLRADAQPVIQEIVWVMKSEPSLRLEVDGHTDGIGSESYNQSLSEERAKTVVASVITGGIEATRLTSAGFGLSKPIADNGSSEGRAENRRVELIRR